MGEGGVDSETSCSLINLINQAAFISLQETLFSSKMFFKMKNIYLSCAYNEYANEATMPSIRVYFWNVDVKQKIN